MLPSLPAGSYTLRAHRHAATSPRRREQRHGAAQPRRALHPEPHPGRREGGRRGGGGGEATRPARTSQREWRWLVRHKRRSVLETAGHEAAPRTPRRLSRRRRLPRRLDLGPSPAAWSWRRTTGARPLAEAGSLGSRRASARSELEGRLTDGVQLERSAACSPRARAGPGAWRRSSCSSPAAATRSRPGPATARATATSALADGAARRPSRTLGAVFVRDRWRLGDRLTATSGARYTYIGFLPDSHHADAVAAGRAARGRPDASCAARSRRAPSPPAATC